MSRSVVVQTVAKVARFLHAETRDRGFKKKGNHLFRSSEDLFHGIHFQVSRWGTSSDGAFTINLVVTAEELYRSFMGKPLPANPASAAFPLTMRIGSLMQDRKDRWWQINDSSDISALCNEVCRAVMTCALPFLDRYPNSWALLSELRCDEYPPGFLSKGQARMVHAVLEHQHGNSDEAERLMQIALNDAAGSPFQDTVRIFAERAGVRVRV